MYSADRKNHANIAAAHSTAITFASATLRDANSESGISGCARLAIAMNSASAAAAPISATVCVDSQPASLPPTIP